MSQPPPSPRLRVPTPHELSALPPQPSLGRSRVLDVVERNLFVFLVLTGGALLEVGFLRLEIGPDSWYSLISGRIVSRSWLPHHDTLTIIGQGREWVDQQWLAHLLLYGLWAAGGWPLALLSVAAMAVVGFAIVAAAARLLGASARSTALVLLACFVVGFTNTSFRAQTPAYVLFGALVLLLATDEARPSRRVFLALPVLAIWANVHGSVVLGAALVALRGLSAAATGMHAHLHPRIWIPRATALIVLPWLCTIASPYGFALPHYYRRILDNPTLSRLITEWQPTTIRNQPQFFVLLLAAAWLAFRKRGGLGLFAQLGLLVSAVAGLMALRHMVWFCLFAAAVLPRPLDDAWPPNEAPTHRRLNVAIAAAALAALVAVAVPIASHSRAWFEDRYPEQAGTIVADAAASDPALRIFADGRYADWLLFEHRSLAGRVAYDVRYELLTEKEFLRLYNFSVERGNGWSRVARGYRLLVLDPSREHDVIDYYLRQRHAAVRYRDDRVVVLELASS
jgi:hypothetical protein